MKRLGSSCSKLLSGPTKVYMFMNGDGKCCEIEYGTHSKLHSGVRPRQSEKGTYWNSPAKEDILRSWLRHNCTSQPEDFILSLLLTSTVEYKSFEKETPVNF